MAYKFDTDTNPNQTLYPPITYPNDPTPRQTYSDIRCLVGGDSVFAGSVDFKGQVTDANHLLMDTAHTSAVTLFACKDNVVNQVLVGGTPQVINVDSGSASKFCNIASLPSQQRGPYEVVVNTVSPSVGAMVWTNNNAPATALVFIDWSVDIKVVANAANAKLSLYIDQPPGQPIYGKCDYHLPAAGESISVNIKSFGVVASAGIIHFNMVSDQNCTVLVDNIQATARMLWQN
jgi:hypothetical protein